MKLLFKLVILFKLLLVFWALTATYEPEPPDIPGREKGAMNVNQSKPPMVKKIKNLLKFISGYGYQFY